jgi:hypothetical protein
MQTSITQPIAQQTVQPIVQAQPSAESYRTVSIVGGRKIRKRDNKGRFVKD